MIEAPTPDEAILVGAADGHTLPPILDGYELPVSGTVISNADSGEDLFIVALTVAGPADQEGRRIQVHRDQLYAPVLKFRSGRVTFEWVERANVIVLEHDLSDGHGLPIEPPPGLIFDQHHFDDWCREFVGIG